MPKEKASISAMKEKVLDPKVAVYQENNTMEHNVDNLALIMDNMRREAASLNISGVDELDRNQLRYEIDRARANVTTVPNDMDPRENNLTH